jgi:glycosyltransferase involved in cell wall biosynthesis
MSNENNFEEELTQYLSYDNRFVVRSVSSHPVAAEGQFSKKVVGYRDLRHLVGRKVPYDMLEDYELNIKDKSELRVAIVCNWNDKCGISTYTGYLAKSIHPKIKEMRIFSEHSDDQLKEDESFVERCWERGENLLPLAEKILDWKPDLVIIQHEYGIFPNAFRFMQFMEALDGTPYVVAMHSVYEHLDKLVYTEACKNIVVHSDDAKETLERLGNTRNIDVIHHGCCQFDEIDELWNIMRSPYTIMQFGFGFNYKGVDRAIKAIAHLKRSNPEKFENIFYFYLCSTNTHNMVVHNEYYDSLVELAEEEGVRDNIAIVRKYQSERMLSLYLRLAKMVVFPYVVNGDNKVYGASGAIRIAMAHGKPVVCSDSHLFDDLEGIIPRPTCHIELAEEIDRIFSDDDHRNEIVGSAMDYVEKFSWDYAADAYLSIYDKIMKQRVANG